MVCWVNYEKEKKNLPRISRTVSCSFITCRLPATLAVQENNNRIINYPIRSNSSHSLQLYQARIILNFVAIFKSFLQWWSWHFHSFGTFMWQLMTLWVGWYWFYWTSKRVNNHEEKYMSLSKNSIKKSWFLKCANHCTPRTLYRGVL